jgi:hypothetical protein
MGPQKAAAMEYDPEREMALRTLLLGRLSRLIVKETVVKTPEERQLWTGRSTRPAAIVPTSAWMRKSYASWPCAAPSARARWIGGYVDYGCSLGVYIGAKETTNRPMPILSLPLRGPGRPRTEPPKIRRTVVISNLHCPELDPAAFGAALSFIKDIRPDCLFLNGDIVDSYEISRFDKDPKRFGQTAEELEMANDVFG